MDALSLIHLQIYFSEAIVICKDVMKIKTSDIFCY